MNKKILVLCIIALAVVCVGVVYAAEVTIANEKFNIPDGFNENTSAAKEKVGPQETTHVKQYVSDKGNVIINVIEFKKGKPQLPDRPGYVNKTINGIDGIYNEDTNSFSYVRENNLVTLNSGVKNESFIAQFLVP